MASSATRVIYEIVGVDNASPAFGRAGRSAEVAEGKIRSLGKAVHVAGLAVAGAAVAVGAESVKMATAFQSSMERVRTQAGASQAEVGKMSKAVLQLGMHTQQGPQQLAEALYHLESLGLRGAKAMRALKAASDLAAVGGANLEDTATAIGAAWRSGIKGAQSFGQAASTVNAIIGAGNMKMEDLIAALSSGILPAAKTFGVSFKSVGAALAVMTDEGIPAQLAATRLRMSLSLLGAPSQIASKWLGQIGIGSLDLARAMRGPQGIVGAIELLKTHLDSSCLSATKQAQVLSRAFGGGQSSSAIMTLVNNVGVLEQKQRQLNKTTAGYGSAVAAQRKTAQAQFAQLKSAIDVMMIELGSKLLPLVTKAVRFVNGTLIPAFTHLGHWLASPAVKPWAELAGKLGAAAIAANAIYAGLKKVGQLTGISKVISAAKGGSAGVTTVAAGNMGKAADTMLTASVNMLRAAGIEADASAAGGVGGAGKAGRAAGTAAKAAGAMTLAELGGSSALWASAVGIIAPIAAAWFIAHDPNAKSSKRQAQRELRVNHLTATDVAIGKQTGGQQGSPGQQPIGNFRQYDRAANAGIATASHFYDPAKEAARQYAQIPNHFYAPGKGPQGDVIPTKFDKQQMATLKDLEQIYGVKLPKAYRIAEMAGANLKDAFTSQSQAAQNARTRMAAVGAVLGTMHGKTGLAMKDMNAYTSSLRLNGNASSMTIGARRRLISDLEKSGLSAKQAARLVGQLGKGINNLGNSASATHPTRRSLIADLIAAGQKASTARGDVNRFANAVKTEGANSAAARGARQKLISDLEAAGLTAKQARTLLRRLQAQIDNMHGKNIDIHVVVDTIKTSTKGGTVRTTRGPQGSAAIGGQVRGVGSTTSDSNIIAVSRDEWIIKASSANKYGPAAMWAVNEGRAVITGYASGGSPAHPKKKLTEAQKEQKQLNRLYAEERSIRNRRAAEEREAARLRKLTKTHESAALKAAQEHAIKLLEAQRKAQGKTLSNVEDRAKKLAHHIAYLKKDAYGRAEENLHADQSLLRRLNTEIPTERSELSYLKHHGGTAKEVSALAKKIADQVKERAKLEKAIKKIKHELPKLEKAHKAAQKAKKAADAAKAADSGSSSSAPQPAPPITVADVTSALATYMPFQQMYAYKRGAWSVPATGPAVVHKNEMIFPEPMADQIREAIKGGSSSKDMKQMIELLGQIHAAVRAVPQAQGEHLARALDKTARKAGAAGRHAGRPYG